VFHINLRKRIEINWNIFSISLIIIVTIFILLLKTQIFVLDGNGGTIDIPEIKNSQIQPPFSDSFEIEITQREGKAKIFVRTKLVRDNKEISGILKKEFFKENRRKIVLRIEKNVKWGVVKRVLQIIKKHGIQHIGVLTKGKSNVLDFIKDYLKKEKNNL